VKVLGQSMNQDQNGSMKGNKPRLLPSKVEYVKDGSQAKLQSIVSFASDYIPFKFILKFWGYIRLYVNKLNNVLNSQ
jgi:hypothetical protein